MTELTLDEVASAQGDAARKYNFAGVALIALAFVGPAVATVFGPGNPFSVGHDTARTLGSLLLLAGVAWLITRNRSDLAKAKGRLVVGILLCITVWNTVAMDAREGAVAREFLRGAVELSAKQEVKFVELNNRFAEMTVNQYITPQALTSPKSMAAAQTSLEQYRSLLQERNALFQAQAAEAQAFVDKVPSEAVRRGAESTMRPAMNSAASIYKSLDVVQRAHADALGALFSWAQANAGKLSMRGDQLMFQTAQQQSELAALASKLQEAESAVDQAVKVAAAERVKAVARRDAALKEGKAFLAQ